MADNSILQGAQITERADNPAGVSKSRTATAYLQYREGTFSRELSLWPTETIIPIHPTEHSSL